MAPSSTPLAALVGDDLTVACVDGTERRYLAFDAAASTPALPVVAQRVTEPPEDGKANAALIKLLAKAWKLPKSAVSLVAGHTDRRKTLAVAGGPAALRPALERWLAGLD